jgi:hypothetical protein
VASKKPVGEITRGTTNPNRLRRVDRYLTQLPVIRNVENPIAVDLGYGKTPITAQELYLRLTKVNPGVRVLGIEIDPVRVSEAKAFETNNLVFSHGGFEIPIPNSFSDRKDVDIIRAFNVLRQYQESEVESAWSMMQSRLSKEGIIIEGTCDEIGRVASWITLDIEGPKLFTISLRLRGLEKPSKVAERLPKSLIHKNTEGNKIFDYLVDLDEAFAKAASFAVFGPSQRFIQTAKLMQQKGWAIQHQPKRWALGELTISYPLVSP